VAAWSTTVRHQVLGGLPAQAAAAITSDSSAGANLTITA